MKAPAHWRAIEFISDLHLAPETPRSTEAFAAYLRATDADAVFILGDLFEAWVGDDAAAEAGSFESSVVALLAEASARRTLGFMVGNRDFLAGQAFLDAAGMLALPDPTLLEAFGQRVLLSHGDALCLDDTAYQAFRQQVRSAAWQQAVLARPLAERRQLARQMRHASEAGRSGQAPAEYADVDATAAVAWLRDAASATLVHGHTHRPATHALPGGAVRHVLSDWDFEAATPRADVLRLSAAGFERRTP